MIGKTLPELVFIRLSIWLLRSTHVLAAFVTAHRLATKKSLFPKAIEYWLFGECLFHFLFYLPRKIYLQKVQAAIHPRLASQARRRVLFDKCLSYIPDAVKFTSTWLQSTSIAAIKRDNYVDWLLWALFSIDRHGYAAIKSAEIEEEISEYIRKVENCIGSRIEDGRNTSIRPLRLTLDPVVMLSRPLVWYTIVAAVDIMTYRSLYKAKFRHYSPPLWAGVFPPRPQTILSGSTSSTIPYWYRPHRSRHKLPVVFLHGIGIGLWPYVQFLTDIQTLDPDIGVLALEILPLSMRITHPMPSQEQFIKDLTHILLRHDFARFVLVSHSYGSILTTHILRSPLAPRVTSLILVDPVSLLLHLADVAYNFVYRKPKTANQWQLWYFASRDMGVAHTLSRHFFWSDNILWKEDLSGRAVGVFLGGEDQVVDGREVWRYLTNQNDGEPEEYWRNEKGDLSVIWSPDLDHAQMFDSPEKRKCAIELLREFTENV